MFYFEHFFCGLVSMYAISCNCVILGDCCIVWSVIILVLVMDCVCLGVCILWALLYLVIIMLCSDGCAVQVVLYLCR